MIAGLLLLTLNDATAKWLTVGYPVPQVIALRGMFLLVPLLAVLLWRGGPAALRPHRIRNQVARSVCFLGSTFFIVTALSLMPLADAVAFTFSGPLIIAALAPMLLGERVGWRRWTAVLVGFAGVIVMARPTPNAFQWVALIAFGAAVMGALRDIVTRKISAVEASDLTLFYSTLATVVVGAAAAFAFPWRMPPPEDFALFALLGALNGGAHFLMIEAYRWSEASVVSPFRYSALVWALLLGFVVWGDVPDAFLIFGAGLVVASGLYILHRETTVRRRRQG